MKALIWNSPWIAQGDLLFYKNCFVKHLLPQANLLDSIGYEVDVITHDLIKDSAASLNRGVNTINLDFSDVLSMVDILSDPSKELYENPNGVVSSKIAACLKEKIAEKYDVIFFVGDTSPIP